MVGAWLPPAGSSVMARALVASMASGGLAIQPLGTYGNLGRTVGHGPEIFGMDFSTLKNFNFAEKRYLQFRFERSIF